MGFCHTRRHWWLLADVCFPPSCNQQQGYHDDKSLHDRHPVLWCPIKSPQRSRAGKYRRWGVYDSASWTSSGFFHHGKERPQSADWTHVAWPVCQCNKPVSQLVYVSLGVWTVGFGKSSAHVVPSSRVCASCPASVRHIPWGLELPQVEQWKR